MNALTKPTDATAAPPPPEGFVRRAATWDDLDAVTSLLAEASLERIGAVTVRRDDLRLRWLGLDDLGDTALLHTADTRALAGYAAFDATFEEDDLAIELHVDGQIHPRCTGHGLASHLLVLAELAARDAAHVHAASTAVVRTALVDGDERARTWFAARRFEVVRHLLELRLDLHAPPPSPVWPIGVTCRTFRPGNDEDRVWRVHQGAFADVATAAPMAFEDFLHDRLGARQDPDFVLLAETSDGIVGVAICRAGTDVAAEDGWIRDLGVLPSCRRSGIGMALLRTAFATFRERGLTGAALDVDDVTLEGAAALYRRAGMRVVHRTDVLERVLTVR